MAYRELTYTYYVGSYSHREQLSEKDWQIFNLEQLFLQNNNYVKRIVVEYNQKLIDSIVFSLQSGFF